VEVGYVTKIKGADCRTGVSVILPRGRSTPCEPTRAGFHSFNGNGEMTGAHWVREAGHFTGPIGVTNTFAVGAVHEGLCRWLLANNPAGPEEFRWFLPVVAETWDGYLNDIEAFSVDPADVAAAIAAATSGPLAEGNVGGGAGMRCYGFKGGSGTSSRLVSDAAFTVGAFVQANFGRRQDLMMRGAPVGRLSSAPSPPASGFGSIIVVLATDAPLSAPQLAGLARRASLGMARTGTSGHHESGDLFIAVSTAPFTAPPDVDDGQLSAFFEAGVAAVEEAILNALTSAETMTGWRGRTVEAIDLDLVRRLAAGARA
jgi:L-aminopeptidase/D-esterase-like protein